MNVPEEITSGDYVGSISINCDEGSSSQEILINIPGLDLIQIKEVNYDKGKLVVNYSFDHSKIIGEGVVIDIWVVDENGFEVKRVQEQFLISPDGILDRSVMINLDKNLVGIYYLYFALSSDLDNFVRQSVVLGDSRTTGRFIWGATNGKMIGYLAFLLVTVIAIFFIVKRHGKKNPKYHNKWLLRKKARFSFLRRDR